MDRSEAGEVGRRERKMVWEFGRRGWLDGALKR